MEKIFKAIVVGSIFFVSKFAFAQLQVNGSNDTITVSPQNPITVTWSVPDSTPDFFLVVSRIKDLGITSDSDCLLGGFGLDGPGDAENPDIRSFPDTATGSLPLSLEHLTPGATYYVRGCYGGDNRTGMDSLFGQNTNTVVLEYRHLETAPAYDLTLATILDFTRLPTAENQWPMARIEWTIWGSSGALATELAGEDYLVEILVDGVLQYSYEHSLAELHSADRTRRSGINIPLNPEYVDHYITIRVNGDRRIREFDLRRNTLTFHVPAVERGENVRRNEMVELQGHPPAEISLVTVPDSGPGWAIFRAFVSHSWPAMDFPVDVHPILGMQIEHQGFVCKSKGEARAYRLYPRAVAYPAAFPLDFYCTNQSGKTLERPSGRLGVFVNEVGFGQTTTSYLETRFPGAHFDGWVQAELPFNLPNLVIDEVTVNFATEPVSGTRCGASPINLVATIRNEGPADITSESQVKIEWVGHWALTDHSYCHQDTPRHEELELGEFWTILTRIFTVSPLTVGENTEVRVEIPGGFRVSPGDNFTFTLDSGQHIFETNHSRNNPRIIGVMGCTEASRSCRQ